MNSFFRLIVVILFISTGVCYAYPEFIGHGYTSCMTCHYNGAGGGPLTDYGRSLFASEIAAIKKEGQSEEEMMDSIAFLGKAPTGKIRPYAKFRELWLSTGLGTKNKKWHQIHMQDSVGVTILMDDLEKWIFSGEVGVSPVPMGASASRTEESRKIISREHYFRVQHSEHDWFYFGFLDKVFGVRTPDHTAYSKGKMGFGQNDQSHGFLWQRSKEKWESFLFTYIGNLNLQSDVRDPGVTGMIEYEPREKLRYGLSGSLSANNYVNQSRGSAHLKLGIDGGHSVIVEVGAKCDQPKTGLDRSYGAFGYFSGFMKAGEGIYATSQGEYLKEELLAGKPEYLRWGLGFAYFPIQRVEVRSQVVQSRTVAETNIGVDSISWQGQLHLSF